MNEQTPRRSRLDRRTPAEGTAGAAAAAAIAISLPGRVTKTYAQGKTISISLNAQSVDVFKTFTDQYTAETGTAVEIVPNASAGGDQVTQLTPQFSSGSTPVDVLVASDEAAPGFIRAGWLDPLDDIIPADVMGDLDQAMTDYTKTWSSLDGKTYRIPNQWSVGYYWTRADLLKELGVGAPQSWDDILALGEKAKAKNLFAFGDAVSQPSLAFVYAAYITGQAGGDLFAFDDGTKQAFEFAKELIDKGYFPKDALNWNYDQSNAAYLNNQLVTLRQWPYFYDVVRADTAFFTEEKATIALPPQGPKQRASWAGAWGWTVPKFTKNPDEARNFVAWVISGDRPAKMALASSSFVTPRKSVLAAIGDQGAAQPLKMYSDANVVVPRPFHPRVSEAQAVIDTVFSSYLAGQYDLDTALETGKSDIEALAE